MNSTLIEYKKLLSEELSKPWRIVKRITHPRTRQRIERLHASINNQKRILRENEIECKILKAQFKTDTNSTKLKHRSQKHSKYKAKHQTRLLLGKTKKSDFGFSWLWGKYIPIKPIKLTIPKYYRCSNGTILRIDR
jgi:hypothetical protein